MYVGVVKLDLSRAWHLSKQCRPWQSYRKEYRMREPQSPHASPRRLGVYERLGGAGGSPAKLIGIAILFLIILIAVIALVW